MTRPLIGVTLDAHEPGLYSPMPWYALRKEYFAAITRHGATPIGLSHETECIEDFLQIIDGLLLTGGDIDIPPELYGEETQHEKTVINESRTHFEYALTKIALSTPLPILGICAGQQLMNVILGGTLIQHIPDEVENALEHQQPTPRSEPWHSVTIEENTLLHRITGTTELEVNSNHHQAVKTVGDNVVINATAPDGVIEGIEYPEHPFCLGVEWHPELEINAGDTALLTAFTDAALAYHQQK